jgi:hypothetical protein
MKELPSFMIDSTLTDGRAETIIDFMLSWCIRCASIEYKVEEYKIFHNYCRNILSNLLEIEKINDDIQFQNIQVWKGCQYIDLWVELEVKENEQITKHAILIEDKYYGRLRQCKDDDGEYRNQLLVYRKRFDAHYKLVYDEQENKGLKPEVWEPHYALITCIKRDDDKFSIYKSAKDFGFKTYYLKELLDEANNNNPILTESDIFNEFWFRWLSN